MKLLVCSDCGDAVALQPFERSCECGRSSGRYLEDGWHVEVRGVARVVGVSNQSLHRAIHAGVGKVDAWVQRPGLRIRELDDDGKERFGFQCCNGEPLWRHGYSEEEKRWFKEQGIR